MSLYKGPGRPGSPGQPGGQRQGGHERRGQERAGGNRPAPTHLDVPGTELRVLAAGVLQDVCANGRSLKAVLAPAQQQLADSRDRALLEAICLAALRQRGRYRRALSGWMPRPLGARDADLEALLLAGFAQLDALKLADHAAVSATVQAAHRMGRSHQAGMVNALLRRVQREGIAPASPINAFPLWLADAIATDWPRLSDSIFAASLEEPPLWLRVHAGKGSAPDYLAQLQQAGVVGELVPELADAIYLPAAVPVAQLPGFAEGRVSVQDGSAQQLADLLADLPAGSRVLDACAAPGGKSAHLLERQPQLQVLALDIDERRARRMGETFARTGVQAKVLAADATDPASWWDGQLFDAIVLDAPCSATGIIRRQPDVLLHRREQDTAALLALQARLMDAAWSMLRPGGRLLYATCSILRAENTGQVEAFLQRTGDAAYADPGEAFGHACTAGRQWLPGEDGRDGFFYAVVNKISH